MMSKLIDFRCPNCGAVKEGFDDEKIECDLCTIKCDNIDALWDGVPIEVAYVSFRMQPIFTPKSNSQRWRHRD